MSSAVSGQSCCPNVTPMSNLESSRLTGQWFNVFANNVGIPPSQHRCAKVHHQVTYAGIFTNTLEFMSISSDDVIHKTCSGTPIDGNKAKLHMVNTADPLNTKEVTILDTDYDNYIIFVTCWIIDGHSGYNVMVNSRQPSLSPALTDRVKEALRAADLDDTLSHGDR